MSVRYPIFSDKIFSKGRILFLHILRRDLESSHADRRSDDEILSFHLTRRISLEILFGIREDWIFESLDEKVFGDLLVDICSKSLRSGIIPSKDCILRPFGVLTIDLFLSLLLECPFLRGL